jgi:hypothetical protein
MRKIIPVLIILMSFYSNAQEIKINWGDEAGREFSITVPSGYFSYGMISGDIIEYGDKYSNNQGDIIKIGDTKIEYADKYSEFFNKVIKVGSVKIEYADKYSFNRGKVVKVGGLSIEYEDKYSDNPGRFKKTEGSVR